MPYQDNFSFTPNLNYSQQGQGQNFKKVDFLKALLDREKNAEKVGKINEKLKDSSAKRAEALKALKDSHDQLGKFSPTQQVAPERIGRQEALWAGGLSALGRALGGADAMPGIASGLQAWSQGRNADFAQRAQTTNFNNAQRDEALLNGLKSQVDMAKFEYNVADDEYSREQSSEAAIEREKIISDRMEKIAMLNVEGRGEIERLKLQGDPDAILLDQYNRREITLDQLRDGIAKVGPSKAEDLKQSAYKKQMDGDLAQVKAMTWPEHMDNERAKVEGTLALLNKSIDDGRFNDWYRYNDLGIRTTDSQNQAARQTIEVLNKTADSFETASQKKSENATKYDQDIAKLEGQVALLQRLAKSPPSDDAEVEKKRQVAMAAYPAKLLELNALRESKQKELRDAESLANKAQQYRERATVSQGFMKAYEISPPPQRGQGKVATNVKVTARPMAGSVPKKAPAP